MTVLYPKYVADIQQEFMLGEINYLDAVERLIAEGMPSIDAEELVESWEPKIYPSEPISWD